MSVLPNSRSSLWKPRLAWRKAKKSSPPLPKLEQQQPHTRKTQTPKAQVNPAPNCCYVPQTNLSWPHRFILPDFLLEGVEKSCSEFHAELLEDNSKKKQKKLHPPVKSLFWQNFGFHPRQLEKEGGTVCQILCWLFSLLPKAKQKAFFSLL